MGTMFAMSQHPITAYREAAGLSPKQFAAKIGVSRPTVSRWESGNRKPDREQVEKITKETGIPASALRPDWAELLTIEAAE